MYAASRAECHHLRRVRGCIKLQNQLTIGAEWTRYRFCKAHDMLHDTKRDMAVVLFRDMHDFPHPRVHRRHRRGLS